MTESKTKTLSRRRVRAVQREREAMEMRIGGAHFDEIAETLGFANASGAFKAVQRAMERARAEATDLAAELRERELLSLDRLERRLWPLAVGKGEPGDDDYVAPDSQAISRILAIKDRRARLMGLDAAGGRHDGDKTSRTLDVTDAREKLYAKLSSDSAALSPEGGDRDPE